MRRLVFGSVIEGCAMASVLGMLEERETAARVRVEGLREEVAWLAGVLEAAEIELDRRVIAREELVEALAASAAETTAVTEAETETVSSPAPAPGSIVPPWREGLPVTVLALDYQRILGVLDERQPAGQGPLKAREITIQLGLEATSAKVEGVRSKSRRLAERGWLLQETSGAFSVGRRPVAVPDAGPSAFLHVDTINLTRIYALVMLEHRSRRAHLLGITANPSGPWTTQAARNFLMNTDTEGHTFLIRDRGSQFTDAFDAVFADGGLRVLKSPPQAPKANAHCERFIGTLRRELLDRTLILNEWHLRRTLTSYLEHYNGQRPHRALRQLCPSQAEAGPPRPIDIAEHRVHRKAVLGGLINEYQISS